MTRLLKPWDAYVQEARRDPVMLPIPGGEQLTINQPSGAVLRRIAESQATMDIEGAIMALFGDDGGKKVMALYDEAPATVLNSLIDDILGAFTIDDVGKVLPSSS